MVDVLQELIDKQDTIEVVRDQIALIITAEAYNQQQLAIAAGKDPDDWKLRVFTEHSNPLEQYLNTPVLDKSPLINVWTDRAGYDKNRGDVVKEQQAVGVYNIDCYGYGSSGPTVDGHEPGDQKAAAEAQRAMRLVRNILMASHNAYLQLRGTVGQRWVQDTSLFMPSSETQQVSNVIVGRLGFEVAFTETAPQYQGSVLEQVNVTVDDTTGQVVIEAQYDYQQP
jgi:hypothetical protein